MATVCYLFLGGTGAGACVVLAVLSLLVPRGELAAVRFDGSGLRRRVAAVPVPYRRLLAPSAAAAVAMLVVGVALLAADLGRADRLGLLLSPELTYLSVGAYALVACMVLACAFAFAWSGLIRAPGIGLLRVLSAALALAGFVVMAYTGLLLSDMPSVPLWHSAWLPALFVLSSLSCGAAVVLATARFFGAARWFRPTMRTLAACDMVFAALEAIAAVGLMIQAYSSGSGGTLSAAAARVSFDELVAGSLAPAFWGGFVLCGVVLPLAANAVLLRAGVQSAAAVDGRADSGSPVAAFRVASAADVPAGIAVAAAALAGAFALRWCIVAAGMSPAALLMPGM